MMPMIVCDGAIVFDNWQTQEEILLWIDITTYSVDITWPWSNKVLIINSIKGDASYGHFNASIPGFIAPTKYSESNKFYVTMYVVYTLCVCSVKSIVEQRQIRIQCVCM